MKTSPASAPIIEDAQAPETGETGAAQSDTETVDSALSPAGTPPAEADETAEGVETHAETDWKKHARQWEKVAKQNKAAADKLATLEDSQKTELQKAVERAEKAEARANQAEISITKAQIAAQHNVPVGLLHGTSKEELETAARALATWAQEQTGGRGIVGGVTGAGGAKEIKKQSGVNVGRERFQARKK